MKHISAGNNYITPLLSFASKLWKQVAAVNKYDPAPEVVAAQDHMTHVMYSMLQPQRIFDR